MIQCAREAGWNALAVTGRPQVARDAHESDDPPRLVTQREFRRQTPAGAAAGVPMQLEAVKNGPARAQDRGVLRGVTFREFRRKNVAHMEAEQFAFFAQPTALDERLVDGEIVTARVFEEERGLRQVVEKLFEQGARGRRGRRRGDDGGSGWVRIHSKAVNLNQDNPADDEIMEMQLAQIYAVRAVEFC